MARPNAAPVAPAPSETRTTLATRKPTLCESVMKTPTGSRPWAISAAAKSCVRLPPTSASATPRSGQVRFGVP